MTFGTRQHRIPAAVIGRFGERRRNQGWRHATIQVLDLATGQARLSTAEAEGRQRGAFDYSDGRTVDDLWKDTENRIGSAGDLLLEFARASFEAGAPAIPSSSSDLLEAATIVRHYIADITFRHAGFDEALGARGHDRDATQTWREEQVPVRRVDYASDTRDLIILTSPVRDLPRLILNSYGWVELRGAETGLLIPLRPDLAVFLRAHEKRDGALEVADLVDHIAEARRAAAMAVPSPGTSGPRFVYAHPEDNLSDVLGSTGQYRPPHRSMRQNGQ